MGMQCLLASPNQLLFAGDRDPETPQPKQQGRSMPQGQYWSAEEKQIIINNWKSKSATQIVAMLQGRTRSAIIGEVRRLRLTGEMSAYLVKRERKHGPRGPRKKRIRLVVVKEMPKAKPPPPPDAIIGRCSVLDLNQYNCHWPFGDPKQPGFYFCGEAALDGRPYCGHHDSISYSTPRERRHQ